MQCSVGITDIQNIIYPINTYTENLHNQIGNIEESYNILNNMKQINDNS